MGLRNNYLAALLSVDWQPPAGAILYADFRLNRFWWNGAKRQLSDLTAIGDGSYTLPFAALGASLSGGFTVRSETIATGNSGSVYFGWRNSGTQEWRLRAAHNTISGVATRWQVDIAGNPNTPLSSSLVATCADFNGSDLTSIGSGFNRSIFSVPIGGPYITKSNMGAPSVGTNTVGTVVNPNGLLHFMRAPDSGALATGIALQSITLWGAPMTEAQLVAANEHSPYPPLHFLGDSFLTHGQFRMPLKTTVDATGNFVTMTQDGIGGTTLTQQNVRFQNTPQAWGSTLIVVDGALEVTGAQAITELTSMVGSLTHDRWAYMQSNPINPIGDSRRTDWIAYDAAIRAFCGPEHYIETLPTMLASGNGSTADNNKIALGQWPTSICTDGVHPFGDGYSILVGLIRAHCQAQGWLP